MEARVFTPNRFLRVGHSMQLIKRFPVNRHGRDFIVSDLHGCLNLLQELLAHVDFDSQKDRLFSTGDLADRGPNSPACLQLLNKPWFHSVAGNHEDMLINYLLTLEADSVTLEHLDARANLVSNGGQWVLTELRPLMEQLPKLPELLCALPMIISVGGIEDDRFHIVHGDLLFDGNRVPNDQDLDALETPADPETRLASLAGLTAMDAYTHAIWSRRLIASDKGKSSDIMATGLSRVYAGHTILESLEQRSSHLFIDGGAFVAVRDPSRANRFGLNLIDHTHQMRYRSNGMDISHHPL